MGLSLDREQRRIASIIIETGLAMGMDWRDVKIGLMTAMQESGMRNLNYGDRDSLGVFQQRVSQGWGTVDQVTDPHYASRKFFSVLKGISGRDQMPLWEAAQSVQRSAYPMAYRQHFGIAGQTLRWWRQNNTGSGNASSGASFTAGPDPNFKPDPHRFDLTTTEQFMGGDKKAAAQGIAAARAPGMGASTEPLMLPQLNTRTDFNQAMQQMGVTTSLGKAGKPNQLRRQIIQFAKRWIGTPYVWGGTNLRSGVDCSGFTQAVYEHFGINLPRISYQQGQAGYKAFGGVRRDLGKLKAGDLVFWDNSSRNNGADHVAIYLGNGMIIEAPRPGRSVGISQLYDMDSAWGVKLNL